MSRRVEKGAIYRHFKGNYYQVLDFAYDATNSEDLNKKMVIYKALSDNKVYVREFKEFASQVNHRKYPEVKQRYRFERVNINKMLKKLLDSETEVIDYGEDKSRR